MVSRLGFEKLSVTNRGTVAHHLLEEAVSLEFSDFQTARSCGCRAVIVLLFTAALNS